MKAPDKLYIEIDNKAHVYFGLQPENAVEYVHKDALIKWLDGKITIEGATEGFVGGYDNALKDVIDKLNSM